MNTTTRVLRRPCDPAWPVSVAALLCLVLGSSVARADEPPAAAADDGWRYQEYMDKPHRWMSRRLGDVSRQIDGFFGTDDLYNEVSGTYGEIRLRNRFTELQEDELDIDFRLKLRVPNTKRKLKLIFESDTEERETEAGQLGSISDSVVGEINEDGENRGGRDGLSDIFAGVRQEIVNRLGLKIDTDLGVKVRTPPRLFARGKLRRLWEGDRWAVRFKETPYWFSGEGFGNKAEFDFDRRLSSRWAARATVYNSWEEDDDVTRLVNALGLYRLASARTGISFGVGHYMDNEFSAFATKAYSASFRWRRRMYEQWLFVEAVPQVVWARSEDFKADYGFTLGIEVLFGETYIDDVIEDLLPPDAGEARGGVLVQRRPDRGADLQRLARQLPGTHCDAHCRAGQMAGPDF